MPLSFLDLPRELRDQIYVEYFNLNAIDNIVNPDPTKIRRRGRRGLEGNTIKHCRSLLLINHQVHTEATYYLYNIPTFSFDDRHHGGVKKMTATVPCPECAKKETTKTSRKKYKVDHAGLHYVHIPHCDYLDILDWLKAIGHRNRSMIRSIHLHFNTSQYTKGCDVNVTAHHYRLRAYPLGGQSLREALLLLAETGNLKKMKITMKEPEERSDHNADGVELRQSMQSAFRNLFLPDSSTKVALCRFRGLDSFEFSLVGKQYGRFKDMPGVHTPPYGSGKKLDLMRLARKGLDEVREQTVCAKMSKRDMKMLASPSV